MLNRVIVSTKGLFLPRNDVMNLSIIKELIRPATSHGVAANGNRSRSGSYTATETRRRKVSEEPTGLVDQTLLLDEQLTAALCVGASPTTTGQKFIKGCCMCLELSGHGVPWFVLCGLLLILNLYTGNDLYFHYGLNILAVLVMDIFLVAPIKLLFKRPRPPVNKGTIPLSVSSIDSYAFPSGHASRCVAVAAYFCYMPPFYLHTHLWYIWALLVSLSRVIIGRHHVLDIVAGMAAGFVIFELVRRLGLLWGV